jgi:flagellar hook-associated protein 1 FlgK
MLTAGRYVNGELIENGTALSISQLQNRSLTSLGGVSATEFWRQTVQELAGATAQSNTGAQAARTVREAIEAQRDAVSGVSIDEESINLLQFQRQYQAAARVISVADELTQQLLNLV